MLRIVLAMPRPCWMQLMRYRRPGPLRWSFLLLAFACATSARAVPAPCAETWTKQGATGRFNIPVDCVWDASAGVSSVVGKKQEATGTPGPPAIIASEQNAVDLKTAGTTPFTASYVLLVGFSLPDPSDKTRALIPAGLASTTAALVALQDVRILVDSNTLQQHIQCFGGQPGVTYYTDGTTFLHINYYTTSKASWQSVGLLLATDLQDARSTSIPVAAVLGTATVSSGSRGLLQETFSISSSSPVSSSSGSTEQLQDVDSMVDLGLLQSSTSSGDSRNSRVLQEPSSSSSSSSSSTSTRVVLQDSSSSGRVMQEATSNLASAAAPAVQLLPPKYGYVLAATNDTLVQHMQRLGAVAGPAAAVIYLDSNVTLSKPPVPDEGVLVARPLVLVGLVRSNTSVDLHMRVNQIFLNETWSNLTVDRLVIENMAPGDAKSAEVARPLSVSSANNFWSLYYRRDENRLFIKNCTMVVGGQSELDYYLYWATVYHSSLPYFKQLAKFIRDVIQITVWELADAGQGDSSIFVVHEVAGSCTVEDSLYTVNDVVAPKLPAPPVDPGLQLNTAAKSPLVTAVSTVASLREQLKPLGPSEAGRTHVVLLRTNITLPAATAGSNSGLGTDVPPGGLPVPHPITILGDFSNQVPAVLDMGYARSLLALPRDAQADQVQVQHLVLKGLAQGPAAAVATSLAFPDVWTILAWAFNRSTDKSVSFSACTLELPPQEFEALQQQATVGGGQVILKMTGDVQANGDGLFVLNDVISNTIPTTTMQVGSFEGHGISGTNITLIAAAAAAAMPGGYHWPGGPLPTLAAAAAAGGGQLSGSHVAAAIAAPVVVVVAVIGGFVALLLIKRRRRQQRQQQQQADLEKALYGLSGDQLLPQAAAGSGSSSMGGSSSSSSRNDGIQTSDGKCSRSASTADWAAAAAADGDSGDQCKSRPTKGGSSRTASNKRFPVNRSALRADSHGTQPAAAGAVSYGDLLTTTQKQQLWSLAQQLDLAEQQQQQQQQQHGLELVQIMDPRPPDQLRYSNSADPAAAAAAGFAAAASTWPGCGPMFGNDLDQPITQIRSPDRQITSKVTVTAADRCRDHDHNSRPSPADITTDSAKSLSDWQTAQQTALASQQQQQQQQSGMLRHGMSSAALAAAAQHLQQKAKQQGFNPAAAVAPHSTVDHAVQQQQQDAAPQQAAAAGGPQLPRSLSGGSNNSNSKPWQRVSSAISILQQGITQRRLEAAYADTARPASTHSRSSSNPSATAAAAAAAGCGVSAAAAQGEAVMTDGVNAVQQHSSGLQLQMLDMIGRGTFASVYRAIWRGRCVAVKVVHLPTDILNDGSSDVSAALRTRERMAVMEAVVSITMSHPNIVQVYTFALRPLPPPHVAGRLIDCQHQVHRNTLDDSASGWELQLVMEYCPEGSLRQILNQQRLIDRSNCLPAVPLVLALAHDVACAMLHLHSENLIHGDLKASNVLLAQSNAPLIGSVGARSSGDVGSDGFGRLSCAALLAAQQAARGGRLVAKVADFGLSLSLAPGDTHVSHMHAGTLTHMAPELLLHGRASKPSDVYAFGILVWELATGRRAFQGVPVALIGHNVAHLRWRPGWLPGIPAVLRMLVEQCWAHEAAERPSFQEILTRLEQLMQYTPDELANLGLVLTPCHAHQLQQQQQVFGAVGLAAPAAAAAAAAESDSSESTPAIAADYNAVTDGPGNGGDLQGVTGDWSLPNKQQQHQQQQQLEFPAGSPADTVAAAGTPRTAATAGKPCSNKGWTGDGSLRNKQQQQQQATRSPYGADVPLVPAAAAAAADKRNRWTGDWTVLHRQQPVAPAAATDKQQQDLQQQDDCANCLVCNACQQPAGIVPCLAAAPAAAALEQQQQQQQQADDLTGGWSMPGRST